ncbi:MAG: 30S ribosomal protein S4e [Candidatus Altiarchaeales archaeon]|nr:30S ribosomal protein S4e [Candidatus Altiarchaeales archaeon]MBD3416347.1 30S ribosomal protein S4e [Candidatus Altiarchaeales archaeon]
MHTKRIAAGADKERKWTTTPRGPHKRRDSIPLVKMLVDLGLADKRKEARKIIIDGKVLVDGKKRKEPSFGVGLMDVVSIPELKKHYRIIAVKKGLSYKEIPEKEANVKLCRVTGKKLVSDGKTQVNLHDGGSLITDKDVKVKDTLVVELPDRKMKEVIAYAVGDQVIVVHGRHRGETGSIKDVLDATGSRKSLTAVNDFQTLTDYVFVVGKDKAMVEI